MFSLRNFLQNVHKSKVPVDLLKFNIKQLLDALILAINMCNALAKDVMENHKYV